MPLIEISVNTSGVQLINTDNIAAVWPDPSGERGCFIDMIHVSVGQQRLAVNEPYANLRKRLKEYGVLLGA